jgi:hypothetical protein
MLRVNRKPSIESGNRGFRDPQFVMDHCMRRIVGAAVHAGPLDGPTICRMFGRIPAQAGVTPISMSSDPLFEFHRWKANLRPSRFARSKQCRTCRCPTGSWNGSSGPFVESFWIACPSGRVQISNGSSNRSEIITTKHVHTGRLMAGRRSLGSKRRELPAQSVGNAIVAGFTSCRSRLSREFAPDTS